MPPYWLRTLRKLKQNWVSASPSPMPRPVEVKGGVLCGRRLFLAPELAEFHDEMARGQFEPFLCEGMLDVCAPNRKVVWDVGAHVGYHTLVFAELVGPDGKVVCFEPHPGNLERLQQNLSLNGDLAARICVQSCGLSDRDGEGLFCVGPRVDDGTSSGSALEETMSGESRRRSRRCERIKIRTCRVDTLVTQGCVPPPSIIKIDVEGAEVQVLRGSVETLKKNRPIILLEIHDVLMMLYCQQLLHSLGYGLQLLHGDENSPARCHVLAVPAAAG